MTAPVQALAAKYIWWQTPRFRSLRSRVRSPLRQRRAKPSPSSGGCAGQDPGRSARTGVSPSARGFRFRARNCFPRGSHRGKPSSGIFFHRWLMLVRPAADSAFKLRFDIASGRSRYMAVASRQSIWSPRRPISGCASGISWSLQATHLRFATVRQASVRRPGSV